MIYTLTLNPALDVYTEVKQFHLGKTNRSPIQNIKVGGKGINVSYALKMLKIPSIPIVVLGGFTGNYIEDVLRKDFVPVVFHNEELTRINFKMKTEAIETEINASNTVSQNCLLELKKFIESLKEDDILIVSGNGSLENYSFLLNHLSAKLILDVRGKLLKDLLCFHPYLVKPNQEELAEVHKDRKTAYEILLKHSDIILHTLGEEGAILKTCKEEVFLPPHSISLKSSVGCGDAFLAGFIAAVKRCNSFSEALEFAQKCASYRAETNEFYTFEKKS